MKVSVELSSEYQIPYAVIYTERVTDEIQKLLDDLGAKNSPITAQYEDKILVLQVAEIYMVRIEGGDTVLYGKKKRYFSKKRLYELGQQLGAKFMQISKTTIVNLDYMDSVETSFNGTLLLKLKNGCTDYVSRRYMKTFRDYLGV